MSWYTEEAFPHSYCRLAHQENYFNFVFCACNEVPQWGTTISTDAQLNVLGSEKIRLMERKMKNEILGFDYSPGKTLQNELCLIKIG